MLRRLLLLAFVALPGASGAQGIVLPPVCARPEPCPVGPANIVHTSSQARVTLENGVMRYEITEVLRNTGTANGEVDYMFPLPKFAAFQDLAMTVNGEMVSGEVLPADRARTIYESIVRRNRDPALVEWMGHGLLRTRIFPIAPGEEKRVVVRLQSVAQREGDAIRVDYFVGTRRGNATAPNGVATSLTFNYPDSARYGTPYSPTHAVAANTASRGTRGIEVSGGGSEITVLLPVRTTRDAAISVIPHAIVNETGFALITLTPPALPPRSTARDVIFVLDVSGSMAGVKMQQAKEAGKRLLATLRPADRFRIVNFGTDVGYFEQEFVTATRANVVRAESYLDALEAAGSTNIMAALDESLRSLSRTAADRLPLVLFVTDGAPTVGETRSERIAQRVADLRGRARVFTFGLGADVKTELLEQLAMEGRGTAHMVRPSESIERAMSLVASRLSDPIVTDLRVSATGVRLDRMHPSDITDLFAGQDVVILARYTGHGPSTFVFQGQTAEGPVRWTQAVDMPEREIRNPFVARLWATQRVGFLSAEHRRNGGNPELDAEIRTLGERYSIPTMFTSYMVVEPGLTITQDGRLVPTDMNAVGNAVAGGVGRGGASGRAGGGGGGGGAATGAATPPPATVQGQVQVMRRVSGVSSPEAARTLNFESARIDAVMRDAKSESALNESLAAGKAKRIGNKVFVRVDSSWIDTQWSDSLAVTRVKPYSALYFELLRNVPDLAPVFALGDRVMVRGKTVGLKLDNTGAETMSATDMAALLRKW